MTNVVMLDTRHNDLVCSAFEYGASRLPRLHWHRQDNVKDIYSYSRLLASYWGKDDLIIWEHDIMANSAYIADLIECPHSNCAWAYTLYPVSTGLDVPVYAHKDGKSKWIEKNTPTAIQVGIGLTKFSLLAQVLIGNHVFKNQAWQTLDGALMRRSISRHIKYHIHWPEVRHLHYA